MMRPSKPPTSRIPTSGGNLGASGGSSTPGGTRGAGHGNVSTPPPNAATSSFRLLPNAGPSPLKFTPFKKPAAASPVPAANALPLTLPPQQEGQPSGVQPSAHDVVLDAQSAALASGTASSADASPQPKAPVPKTIKLEESPHGSGSGSTITLPDIPAAHAAAKQPEPVANGPVSDISGVVGHSVCPATWNVSGDAKGQSLQQRLEKMLVEAGVSTAQPEGIKVLAAAIVEACQVQSYQAVSEATTKGCKWWRLNGAGVAVSLVGFGALAICLVWVLCMMCFRDTIPLQDVYTTGYST